jgi:hypothetical protein
VLFSEESDPLLFEKRETDQPDADFDINWWKTFFGSPALFYLKQL